MPLGRPRLGGDCLMGPVAMPMPCVCSAISKSPPESAAGVSMSLSESLALHHGFAISASALLDEIRLGGSSSLSHGFSPSSEAPSAVSQGFADSADMQTEMISRSIAKSLGAVKLGLSVKRDAYAANANRSSRCVSICLLLPTSFNRHGLCVRDLHCHSRDERFETS